MYCKNCGHQNVYTAKFCQSCGEHLDTQISADDGQASFHSWSERNKIDLFIGTNQSHYFHKWIFSDGTLKKWGFNWVALFFGIIWFGYRKMYGWMTGIFFIQALLTVIYYISLINEMFVVTIITYISSPVINLILAMFANKMYFHHVRDKVKHLESQYGTTADFTNALKYKGGTSGLGIFLAIVMSITLTVCSAIMAIVYVFTTDSYMYDYNDSYYDDYYYDDTDYYYNEYDYYDDDYYYEDYEEDYYYDEPSYDDGYYY